MPALKKIMGLLRAVDNVNSWLGTTIAFIVLPIVGVSMYEVIARYVFNRPTMWGGQILSILFVALVVLGGGYVLLKDGHVRMDVLYSRWSPRRRAITDVATFVVFLLFTTMLAWQTVEMAWASVKIREASWAAFHGPIYPKKVALALATVLLLLQGISRFVRNIRFIKSPGIDGANSEH